MISRVPWGLEGEGSVPGTELYEKVKKGYWLREGTKVGITKSVRRSQKKKGGSIYDVQARQELFGNR